MKTRVQKWGNSLALRIPKSFRRGSRASRERSRRPFPRGRHARRATLAAGAGRLLMNSCAASRRRTFPASGRRDRPSARRSGEPKGDYIPERGDAVWITLDPQAGHEQAGRRPAPCCRHRPTTVASAWRSFGPITNQAKGYPFEVAIPDGYPVTGVVGADQVKEPRLASAASDVHRRQCRRMW